MTEKRKANDWLFAGQLEIFKQRILDPLKSKTEEALKILQDDKRRWDSPAQKEKANTRYKEMSSRLDLYNVLYGEGMRIIHQHEDLVDTLANLYASWYNIVSTKGRQPSEMMSMQADELQRIFMEIYKILEPLKLPIQKPEPKE